MKKFILLLFLTFSLNSFTQSWKYNSGGNAFDGKYKVAYVIGKCSDFPYNNPVLTINNFEERNLNFYISNSGHYSDEDDVEVLFIFDAEPNTIYSSDKISLSKDNETIFLISFKTDKTDKIMFVDEVEFIEKFKKSSKLDVRIKSRFKDRDMLFSLSGSSNAINYVITPKFLKYLKDNEIKQKKVSDSIMKVEQVELENYKEATIILENILSGLKLNKTELNKAISEIKSSSFKNKFKLSDIKTIESGVTSRDNLYLYLYDENHSLIKSVRVNLPSHTEKIITEKLNQERQEKIKKEETIINLSKENLQQLIQRFDFEENTQQSILNRFEEIYKEEKFNLKDIDSTNLILPYKKTNKVLLRIYSNDKWVVSLFDFELNDDFKKNLKVDKSY